MRPPAPVRRANWTFVAPILLLITAPVATWAEVGTPEPPVVEALFLCDPVPPGGLELGLVFLGRQTGPGPFAAPASFDTESRLQLALALGDRFGFTADVRLGGPGGLALDSPSASLKTLLVDGGDLGPSLASSLDLLGAPHSLAGTELGVGLGLVLPAGRVTWRASLSAASAVAAWGPHVHGGLSAAMAFGGRVRAFAEVIGTLGAGGTALAAGPGLKLDIDARTAISAGALLGVGRGGDPLAVTVVLTQAL